MMAWHTEDSRRVPLHSLLVTPHVLWSRESIRQARFR